MSEHRVTGMRGYVNHPLVKRLVGCLAGGVVLAMMWGKQEGTNSDYGYAFRQSVLNPRIVWFLLIGAIAFALITFWPRVRPYITRPGALALFAGFLIVGSAQLLLHWDDKVGTAKFSDVADAVSQTPNIAPLTGAFFGWLAWVQLIVVLVIGGYAVAARQRIAGWVSAVLAVVAAVIAYSAHHNVISFAHHTDHSLGAGVAVVGYATIAAAGLAAALSGEPTARTRGFIDQAASWRPGMPAVVMGLLLGVIGMAGSTWFSPGNRNATLSDTRQLFLNTGLAPLAVQYLAWLGWILLAVAVLVSAAAAYLRHGPLGWVATVVGVAALLLTLVTLYDISSVAAGVHYDSATGPWQNLGTGGWITCAGFLLLAGGGLQAATARRMRGTGGTGAGRTEIRGLRNPATGGAARGSATQTLALVVLAAALFYPPTATSFWQNVLSTEIGIYVLLAVGLNVVVGWAGLLDLGYIAFYAIGSYTTAYLTGSLPVQPPSWLHLSSLWAIPFAIVVALLAGVLLGAPTLRLRGDYLAIVTLGFGEIIRIIAVNSDSVTNGPRGVSSPVPHPTINLGFLKITWGLNNLQYWYLLLVFTVAVILLFRRLEHSRLGRAWAAIREDEVAAAATGIDTTRVKLLAFAIGASTSGLAGVLFATQVGYFNPDNFVLNNSILVVAYVVFGGMGSLPGAIAGAASLIWLQEFLRDQVPQEDRQMWVGALVLLMMIFRAGGLIPARRRSAELGDLGELPELEAEDVPVRPAAMEAAR